VTGPVYQHPAGAKVRHAHPDSVPAINDSGYLYRNG
jgi:hypothetical protein